MSRSKARTGCDCLDGLNWLVVVLKSFLAVLILFGTTVGLTILHQIATANPAANCWTKLAAMAIIALSFRILIDVIRLDMWLWLEVLHPTMITTLAVFITLSVINEAAAIHKMLMSLPAPTSSNVLAIVFDLPLGKGSKYIDRFFLAWWLLIIDFIGAAAIVKSRVALLVVFSLLSVPTVAGVAWFGYEKVWQLDTVEETVGFGPFGLVTALVVYLINRHKRRCGDSPV